MEWKGDEERLGQLCQLFQLASSPDNRVQQQVMQMLQQFSQLPDFNMYLATVFAKLTNQDEVVRQRAGLLLKTNVGRVPPGTLQPAVAEYVQAHALSAVRDSSKVIRHTAGTVISILVLKVGILGSRSTLDQLAGCLGDPNANTVEGSFNALNKICEDGMMLIKQTWDYPDQETQHFVSWSAENLLPKVMQYASPQAPLHARQNAIECLNHFALNWAFNEPKFPQLQPFAGKYLEVLGVLANDQDPNVLKDVCKGFVCVIENQWTCVTPQTASVVLQYMLKACKHPEYMVRVEALEVWTPCTNSPMLVQCVWSLLNDLIPVLLENMVYSQADYMAMEHAMWEDDNAAVPDAAQDIKPRTHKEQGDEEDDDGGAHNGGGAWGAEWTARKAAASSLDNLSHMYRENILEVVLPLISRKLEHESWEVQESGVLALGAIAFGCMEGLTQYMPKVMDHLLKLCQAPKPLLRSISCWTVARFSTWICNERVNPLSEQVLRSVLQQLLTRVLDKNKRVQEAACSAFATLEEMARHLMVPYLSDIVQTLSKAFQYYQAKNLLILYDAVGTLADSVGPELDTPTYKQQLLEPLFQKFNNTPDNDRSIIALFECLSSLASNLGPSFLPLCKPLVERCTRLIINGAQAAQMWMQNPNEFEKPDREVMAASIDLLSGIVAGLQGRISEVLQQQNFLSVVPEVLKDTALQVKQSAFALVGDSAKHCIDYLWPFLPQLLPQCAKALRENTSATVSNNASWAVGEICIKVSPDFMSKYLDEVVDALVSTLRPLQPGHHNRQGLLLQNVCITLGRLGVVCGPQMGKKFGDFAQIWCIIMKDVRIDGEKVTAFQGFVNMVNANPQVALRHPVEFAGAIASLCPPPPQLHQPLQQILTSYKQTPQWPQAWQQLPQDVQLILSHVYSGPEP